MAYLFQVLPIICIAYVISSTPASCLQTCHMRKFLIAGLVCLCTLNAFSQKENKLISSRIEKVTVFLQGAQVERTAKQALPAGKYNILFSEISPRIDKQSIQLKAEGKLTVLSVTHQLNHLKEHQVQNDIRIIETQKEQLLEKIALEKNMKNVYSQEEQIILKNQTIKGDNATLKAAELKEAADFQRLRLTEVYQKLLENERSLKKMEQELQKINTQLQALHQKKDLSTSELTVSVDVKENTTGVFRLSYLVLQSSWFPTYDVRVQDISQPLNLQMKANLQQQSGEDWTDVKLFLSTGNPNENGSRPVLLPWYLRYYMPVAARPDFSGALMGRVPGLQIQGSQLVNGSVKDENGMPISGATVIQKGSSNGTLTDAGGNFSLATQSATGSLIISMVGYESKEITSATGYNITLKPSASHLEEVVVTAYGKSDEDGSNFYEEKRRYKQRKDQTAINTTTSYQATATIFEIEDPYSVPDDGKTYTVEISSYELDAVYEYYAAPKLDPSAYLTAKIPDWQQLNLLPGEANLFFEGTFLGSSHLDLANAGDTLNLSLGKDKGVVVKRTLLKEFSSRKFLGSNKTDSRQYETVVRNNKQHPIRIIVEDQFPVSTNKDIEVDKLSYEAGKLEEDTRKVSWQLLLEAKKESKLHMGYVVKYPKDRLLQLD